MKKMLVAFLLGLFVIFLASCQKTETPEKLQEYMPSMIFETLVLSISSDDLDSLSIHTIEYNFYYVEMKDDEDLVEKGFIGLFWITYTVNTESFSAFVQMGQEIQSMDEPLYSLISDVKQDYDQMVDEMKPNQLDIPSYIVLKYSRNTGTCTSSEIDHWLTIAKEMIIDTETQTT